MNPLAKLLGVAAFGASLLAGAPAAQAQNRNNFSRPKWGPAIPKGAQYYYIPETKGFYDVPARQYVVPRNGQWVRTTNLTGANPAKFHPVVVDYVGAQPWTRYDEYNTRYPQRNDDGDNNDNDGNNNDNDRDNNDGHHSNSQNGDHRGYERRDNNRNNGNNGYDNRQGNEHRSNERQGNERQDNDRREDKHGNGQNQDNGHGNNDKD